MTRVQTNKKPIFPDASDLNSQLKETTSKRPRANDTEEPDSKKQKCPDDTLTAESTRSVTDEESSFTTMTSSQLLEKTQFSKYGTFVVKHECDCWFVIDFKFSTNARFKQHVLKGLHYLKDNEITLVFQKSRKTHQYPCAAATQIYRGRGIYLTSCRNSGRHSRD